MSSHLPVLAALFFALLPAFSHAGAEPTRVAIVLGPSAPALEQRAAAELAEWMRQLFRVETLVQTSAPPTGSAILLGTPETNPAVKEATAGNWPALSAQGHLVKSVTTPGGARLVLGGGSPVATLWAVHELGYRFGIRHLLQRDFQPVEKPKVTLEGFDLVLEPRVPVRAWSAFQGEAFSAESWDLEAQTRLIGQLAKLKFTHFVLPAKLVVPAPIRIDGESGGRAAFRGAREFRNGDLADPAKYLACLKTAAEEAGLSVEPPPAGTVEIAPGPAQPSLLPQFDLQSLAKRFDALRTQKSGIIARIVVPGDLNASIHFLSRASFTDALTPTDALSTLATPICGAEVDERLRKGFEAAAEAASLIAANDPALAVADARMIARHLVSTEPPPAWWKQARDLYTSAMNEMYRANTRARDGARPWTLYHAKRFEFAIHFLTSLEAARKAAPLKGDPRAEALEPAIEAMYNALNAYAEVARDPSDQGAIALLNEHGYRPLLKALAAASGE